ncbi:cerevisin [Enteropsectra breve]|nr:cerevisin [Enteropsectra breve]
MILHISAVFALSKYIVMFKTPANKSHGQIKTFAAHKTGEIEKYFSSQDKITKRLSNGFSAELTHETKQALERDSSVLYVEKDAAVQMAEYEIEPDYLPYTLFSVKNIDQETNGVKFRFQKDAPWGISQISGHKNRYEYISGAGKGITVYVLDSGVDVEHRDFEGRASFGYNGIPDSPDTDENGHGTHCAGTIAGSTHGIAKNANIVAVKVLDREGGGLISTLIEGIDYVMHAHEKKTQKYFGRRASGFFEKKWSFGDKGRSFERDFKTVFEEHGDVPKAVINMSIGGKKSPALNFAIKYASTYLGIHFALAAGNESENACSFSPSSAKNAATVGATNLRNRIAGFSNIGGCVDLYAPGVKVASTWPNGEIRVLSGTSMAAPHVAGVMAVYLTLAEFRPSELIERLIKDSVLSAHYSSGILAFSSTKRKEPSLSLTKLYSRLKSETDEKN